MIFPVPTPFVPTPLDHFADLELLVAGLLVAAFTLLYATFSRPWRTSGGLSVFLFTTALDFLLALIIISKFTGSEYPGRDVVRVFVYGYTLITAFILLINLIHTWWRGNLPQLLGDGGKRPRVTETPAETYARLEQTNPGLVSQRRQKLRDQGRRG